MAGPLAIAETVTGPLKTLDWDDFRLIKAIAEARSLPAAAQIIGVNHSTVFRRLAQIEQALGITLFERHRTGYTATPAGELRVTTNDTLLVHLLTPLLAQFRQQCPDVRLDMVLSNQALNLSKRDADVAIRATDNPPENLVGRRVATIAWALYGRAADFPEPTTIDLGSLCERNWVALGDNLATLKAVKFVQSRVPPERIAYKVNTVLGLTEAVESGIGVGHLPCFIADARPMLLRLMPPDPEFATGLWLLTHPDLRNAPRVRLFLDFLAVQIGKQRRFIEGAGVSIA